MKAGLLFKYSTMMENSDFPKFPVIIKKKATTTRKSPINQRLVRKSGELNLQLRNIPSKGINYVKDYANTLVSLRWRWVILIIILTHGFFFVLFAGLWMLDAWLSDDFNVTKSDDEFCIENARSFAGYLLLSIESITTTGYGYLYPNDDHCKLAWIILTLNTIVMIFIDGAFISVVFLKICRPLKRYTLTMFSKHAVICLRNGKLCLIFRIYDYNNKHGIGSTISAFVLKKNIDEYTQINCQEIQINPVGLLLWPVEIVHEIDSNSPFWELSAIDLMNESCEIVVEISGTSLVTCQFTTSQTSYLTKEICWGYRFKSCMEFNKNLQKHVIDEDAAISVMPTDTPLCSAKDLEDIKNGLSQN